MIVGPVDPGYHARLDPVGIGQLTRLGDIGDEGRGHDISQGAKDQCAPGTMPFIRYFYVVLGRDDVVELPIIIEA